MTATFLVGDNRALLPTLPSSSVQCCVTSPPYWNLRDYGVEGQAGSEETPEAFVANLVAVFREVRRILVDDGTLWLNLGDSYAGSGSPAAARAGNPDKNGGNSNRNGLGAIAGLKPKDLVGIPWMVAFALRADGWFLRSDIIWHKPNPMPESVTDRPTKAHEHIFLLSKSERYFYDAAAIKEPASWNTHARGHGVNPKAAGKNESEPALRLKAGFNERWRVKQNASFSAAVSGLVDERNKRNKRDVWTVPSQPYAGAHHATFPPKLIEPCILAGCPVGGTVLDPFGGAGTTAVVAAAHDRHSVSIELNPAYAQLARERYAESTQQGRLAFGGAT